MKTYLASPPVETGLVVALIADPGLAVGAGVAGRAGARVRPLPGVAAGGAVLARAVVGAVVEILVAEEAAPAVVAAALVRLLAGAVDAARVANAGVAQWAGVAGLASVKRKKGIRSNLLYILSQGMYCAIK